MVSFGEEFLRFESPVVNVAEGNRSDCSRSLTSDLIRTREIAVYDLFNRNSLRADNKFVNEVVLFVSHFRVFHFAYRMTCVVSSVRKQISRGVEREVTEVCFLSVRRGVDGEAQHGPAVGISGKIVNDGIPLTRYEFGFVGKALSVRSVNVEKVVVAGVCSHHGSEFIPRGGKVVHTVRSGIALESRRNINHERSAVYEINFVRERLVSLIRNICDGRVCNGVIPIVAFGAESELITIFKLAVENLIERTFPVRYHIRARFIFHGVVVNGDFDSARNGHRFAVVSEKNHRFTDRFRGYGESVEFDVFFALFDRSDDSCVFNLFGVDERFRFYFVRSGIDVVFEYGKRNFILSGFNDIRLFDRNRNGFRRSLKSFVSRFYLNYRCSDSDAADRSVLGNGNLSADGVVSIRNAFGYFDFLIRQREILFDVRRFSFVNGKRCRVQSRRFTGVLYLYRVNDQDVADSRADFCRPLFLSGCRNYSVLDRDESFVRTCPRGKSRNRLG